MKKTTATLLLTMMVSATAFGQVTMNVDATRRGPLTSPYQYGLFFEEINHAGEGGLYAELVKNRSFEDGTAGWSTVGGAQMSLGTTDLLNAAQGNDLLVNFSKARASAPTGVANSGYWGMAFRKDSTYTLSFWAKGNTALSGKLLARLMGDNGEKLGEATLQGTVSDKEWTKLTATLKATGTAAKGSLQLLATTGGQLRMDVVSLFPYTWNARTNGLRPDLAQLLYDTHPRFVRFPGGCYVEGQESYDNAFQWKKTIGPIETRPGHWNKNWGYWSSDGLGFDEYLQMCEDLGAAPLFVVNVGLGHGFEFSLDDTKALVQDCLDAIEYANGDASTTWGAKRVANGHAEPYNLKFIEIGNENYQAENGGTSSEYAARYKMFYDAVKAKYPDIICIGNVEAWGTDNPSWRNPYPVDVVDEHYYRTAAWMVDNYNKYDNASRAIAVYNGEYAANSGSYGRYGNMNSALGEAVYMLGMERNSDVCRMASFAPIFTHESNPTWAYDMIHFNAASNFVTPSYYVQQLMAKNVGTQNLLWTESGNMVTDGGTNAKVGVGTWSTQASYDEATLTTIDGEPIASDDFSGDDSKWSIGSDGDWTVTDGVLSQTGSGASNNCTAILNTPSHGNYIYKVRARKDSGSEGFLIVFNYDDANNFCWWNIGGWGNTRDAVELCVGGGKTTVDQKNFSVETGRWYDVEVRVNEGHVDCILDGDTIHSFNLPVKKAVYQSVQLDSVNNELVVKLANTQAHARTVTLNLKNMKATSGTVTRLAAAAGTDENTMDDPARVRPTKTATVSTGNGLAVQMEAPAYSLSIYRFKVDNVAQAAPANTYKAYEKEDSAKTGYLFAHMNSGGEYTNYALSRNGQNWTDLLSGAEAFSTKDNTVTGGMRDAFVYRLKEGGFMLVATDMTSRLGWTSNHIMDLMLTPDLVHWTKNVKIDLESNGNLKALGGISADDMKAAWAPQVIYDDSTHNYVLYYTVGFPDRHRIYYQLIDKDLNILTEPRLYFDPGYDIIDADIVYNAVDNDYQMVYKCESANGLNRATARHLVPSDGDTSATTVWTVTSGFHVSDNNQSIEAPTQWREIGGTKWRLSFMNYSGGGYGYKTLGLDEHGLNPSAPVKVSGSVAAQHGSILKLTETEYSYLLAWDSVKTLLPQVLTLYNATLSASAKAAIDMANDALSNTTTVADNQVRMHRAAQALAQVAGGTEKLLREDADKGIPTNLTPLIANADFSKGSASWNKSTSFTQANGKVAEFFDKNFDFHQTITDLPAGDYVATVQSCFRNGSINDAVNAHADGRESLDAVFYANDSETAVMSLYDDSITKYTYNPYTYPDNVTQANEAFNTYGLYTNTVRITLDKRGDITLGIHKENWTSADWCCFDNFTLRYLGNTTGISNVSSTKHDGPIYNLQGQRVSDKGNAHHGVFIKNGRKVIR